METLAAVEAVTEALGLTRGGVRAADISLKGERDVVTTVDVAVEQALRARLADVLGLPSIGEEHGGSPPTDGSGYWLIDPICGTRNFASGTPLYSINLALVEAGEVTIAVVGDPSRDEILVAERGRGAWALADGARDPLAVNDSSGIVIVEDGRSNGRRRGQAASFVERLIRADRWDFRSLGTTLSLPYLAAGRVSAYVVFCVTAVHSAAGALLATEAGSSLSDIDGAPWTLESDTLLACASARVHDDLLALADTP